MSNARNISKAESRFVNATGDTITGLTRVEAPIESARPETLGTTAGDYLKAVNIIQGNGNVSNLEIMQVRTSDGGTWNSAGTRIQERIDSSYMGYVQFNGHGNDWGVSIGTGGGTSGPTESTERLRVDSLGRVTTPYQPAFRAVCASSYSVPASTNIVFSGVVANTGNHYSSSTGVFTAPVAGWYHFSFNLRFAGITYYSYRFLKNGAVQQYYEAVGPGGAQSTNHGNSHTVYLASGDSVQLQNGSQGGLSSDSYASFSGFLIG